MLPGSWVNPSGVPAQGGATGGAREFPENAEGQEIIIDVGSSAGDAREGYQQIFIRHQESGELVPVFCTSEEVRELLQNCPEDSSAEGNTLKPAVAGA